MPKKQKYPRSSVPPSIKAPIPQLPLPSLDPPTLPFPHPTAPTDPADWRAKNSRAKAIIMSTLVPGSEPWAIAEPLELASDIWKALEERYAPAKQGEMGAGVEGKANGKAGAGFIKKWVEEGKGVVDMEDGGEKEGEDGKLEGEGKEDAVKQEKEINTAKTTTANPTPSFSTARNTKPIVTVPSRPPRPDKDSTTPTTTPTPKQDKDTTAATFPAQPQPPNPALSVPTPLTSDLTLQHRTREQKRKQAEAQAAAAKILVEHMPSRDQRFLWALLHGGKEETMAWFNGTGVAASADGGGVLKGMGKEDVNGKEAGKETGAGVWVGAET